MTVSQILRIILFSISVLCFTELLNLFILPISFENYPRYETFKLDEFSTKINGRGAIGELYRGQKLQLAFLGDSTLFQALTNEKTLPEKLKRKLQATTGKKIHVDNFSVGKNNHDYLLKQLQILCRQKRFYNLIFIQISFNREFRDFLGEPSPYYKRRMPNSKYSWQTLVQLKKWYQRMNNKNPFHSFFPKEISHFQKYSPEKRHHPLFQDLFIDYKINFTEESKQKISIAISKIKYEATCISNKLIWMTPFFLYHEKMLKSYIKNYAFLWVIPKTNPKFQNFLFVSPKAWGEYAFRENQFVKKKLKEHKIVFIDLFSFMQKQIQTVPNLFTDEIHASEKGFKYIIEYIYPKFEKILFSQESSI